MSLRGLVCLCGDRVGLCCVGVGVTFGGWQVSGLEDCSIKNRDAHLVRSGKTVIEDLSESQLRCQATNLI